MTLFTRTAQDIFAPTTSDGTPRGANMAETQVWGTEVERVVTAFVSNGGLIYETKAAMDADAAYSEPRMAWVIGDPTVANNGIYRLNPSVDLWVRAGDLPYSFVQMSDAGAGTANAIQLTSAIPTSQSVLRIANVFETNAGNVTISENGSAAKPLLTASGNQIAPAGIMAGMMIAYIDAGSSFRMISDQASASIQAAAEAAQAAAEAAAEAASDYADFARNNWVVAARFIGTGEQEDYPLSIDPGSENNMFVSVGGVDQAPGGDTPPWLLVYDGGDAFIRIAVPNGVSGIVRTSNAVDVGTPSDGSVTEPKIANNAVTTSKLLDGAVTYAKLQDISAALRLLGRDNSGAGDAQELTAAQLRDLFLPAGSVVDSVVGSYTANADITGASAVIPVDDSVPQITEGVELISVTITPKSTTNKLRIRYSGFMSVSQISGVGIAIFKGTAAAIHASAWACPAANYYQHVCGEVEYVPGVTTAQTISLRVGPANSAHIVRMNGNPTNRLFGGVAATRLVVEEIKG
ncbi:hypothetical protein G6N76_09790 [Rhizobium daejeonense]|uniref:Uncharacterized protein n=1 Tax=Rhizobium daejeonense TaxID=240521 RepID=A0A6M1RYM6_9HYPH|nr:hypothetical protein [Rhizobium daejeonense]NGO63965.1 hypothetical protein [Rhizobium daejeonense]